MILLVTKSLYVYVYTYAIYGYLFKEQCSAFKELYKNASE